MTGVLSAPSRLVRNVAAVCVAVGLVAGSTLLHDDDWPLAPFRMFAGTPHRNIWMLALDGVRPDGRIVRVPFEAFRLRRAEAEGQWPRIVRNPRMLKDILDEYNARVPRSKRLVGLRLIERKSRLRDGRLIPSSRTDADRTRPIPLEWHIRVLASWPPR